MKGKIKFLTVFVMILLIGVINVNAATDLKITDVKPASYTTKKNPIGAVVSNEDFKTTVKDTTKSLILTSTSKFIETEMDDYDSEYGYYKHNYVVNYTNDGENYKSFDLTNFVKENYECDNSDTCRIYFRTVFNKDNTFYMVGYIEKVEPYKDEYDNEFYNHNFSSILIKTNDGEVYEKADNLPTYNYNGTGIYTYNDTYMLVGEKYLSGDEKYEYYTSTDLINWEKHELTLADFGYTSEEIEYIQELVKYHGISSWGVHFTSGYEKYIDYNFPDYSDAKTIVTKDFNKYTLIDESEVTAANSKAYCEEDEYTSCDFDYTNEWSLYKTAGEFTSKGQTVGIKFANKIPSGPIGGLYTKGWDMYIMLPGTNKYVPLIGNKNDYSYMSWYYTWSDKENTNYNKIFIFSTKDKKSKIYYFNDYEKSLDYTEYNIGIDSKKINDYLMNENNQMILLYDNKYLLITDLNLSKITRMKIPTTKDIEWTEDEKNIYLINDDNIYTMSVDSIYSAPKLEKEIGAPKSFTKSTQSTSSITLKWNKPIDKITGYQIYMATSVDGKYSKIATISKNSTKSYKKTKLSAGTTYYFKIRSYYKTKKKTYYSDFVETSATTTPKTPSIKTSTSTSTVVVKWNKISGATSYEVYQSTDKKKYTKVATTSELSYKIENLKSAKTYYYKVRAVKTDNNQNIRSSYSKVVSATTKPLAPTITVTTNSTSVTIKWNKVSGASGYEIYQSTNGKKYTKITTITKGSTTSYKKTKLSAAKGYIYKVRAYKTVSGKKIYSSYSESVTGVTTPSTPTSVKATLNDLGIKISYKKVSGVTGYEIYTSADNKNYVVLETTKQLSYVDTTIVAGQKHYYKVRSYKEVNGVRKYSGYSKVVSYTKPVTQEQ